jgi:tetrapyrrole methylase family protein/MazG family protein
MEPVLQKLEEELQELREAMAARTNDTSLPAYESTQDKDRKEAQDREVPDRVEAEFGDVLFTLVNLARFIKINPEEALRKTITRFTNRFHFLEAHATATGRSLEEMTPAEMDALWDEAKLRTSD